MIYQVLVGTERAISDVMNGVLHMGPYPVTGVAVGAKTLIFTDPSATITFTGSSGDLRTPSQILAQMKDDVAGMEGEIRLSPVPGAGFYLVIWIDGGFTIDKDGTANATLKLSTVADTVSDASATPLALASGTTLGNFAMLIGRTS